MITGETKNSKLILYLIVFLGIGIFLLFVCRSAILPFVISILLVYLLNPLVDQMEKRGLGKTSAVVILYLSIILLFTIIAIYFFPILSDQIRETKENLPKYISQLKEVEVYSKRYLESHLSIFKGKEFASKLSSKTEVVISNLLDSILSFIFNFFSLFSLIILVPLITFFLLKDGRRLKKAFIALVPNRYFETSLNLMNKIDIQITNFIRGQLLDVLIVSILYIIGLYLIGLDYYIILGIIMGISILIPYFGPAMGTIPAIAVALLSSQPILIIGIIVVLIIVQLIDNALICPTVVAQSVKLHPLLIVFGVLTGGQLLGVWGMLLTIPIISILKVIIEEFYQGLKVYRQIV
ncbi:MAG: AI-2E family transporter [bacterium]|nr:AI-2E family transporter [bacterium]